MIYSLDERKIGTWIDGSNLYQKTIQLTDETYDSETKTYSIPFDCQKLIKSEHTIIDKEYGDCIFSDSSVAPISGSSASIIATSINNTKPFNVAFTTELDGEPVTGLIITTDVTTDTFDVYLTLYYIK